MTNQAAQTMPEPIAAMIEQVSSVESLIDDASRQYHDSTRWAEEPSVYDDRSSPTLQEAIDSGFNKLRDMLRDYAAALSQTAGVVEGWKLVPVKATEAMQEAFNDWRPTEGNDYAGAQSVSAQDRWEFRQRYAAMLAAAPAASGGDGEMCPNCVTPWKCNGPHESTGGASVSGGEDGALNLRGDETNQEVLVEFIRVCREVKPVGQWPGERVCRAIENLMNGPRDFISPDDRSPLRFGVGRGNEGGRLGLMGRDLAQPQHDAAGGAKCIWPDCGHDTNQVGYSSGCAGAYCPASNPSAASVSERARAIEILAGVCLVPPSSIAENTDSDVSVELALRALEQALTQQRGELIGSIDPRHLTLMKGRDGTFSGNIIRVGKSMQPGDTLLYTTPQPSADAVREVPDGMVLVPARMELTPENMETLVFMLGGDPEAEDVDERWNGGTLWVGETIGDNGEKYYGLNVANVECYEEGSVPIVEFAAAIDHQQNAAQGGGSQ